MPSDDEVLKQGADVVTRVAISHAAQHLTTAATGNPTLGRAAGMAAGAAYSKIPDPVKGGAAVGGFVAVHAATHIASAGTVGAFATAASALALAPWLIAGGAVVGGLLWLFSDN